MAKGFEGRGRDGVRSEGEQEAGRRLENENMGEMKNEQTERFDWVVFGSEGVAGY